MSYDYDYDEERDGLVDHNEEDKSKAPDMTWRFRFRTLNGIACLVHFVMFVVVLIVAALKDGHSKCIPITQTYNGARPGNISTSAYEVLPGPGLCFAYMAAMFELVCFLAHAFIYFMYTNETFISEIIDRQMNPWRWIEYSISATIMFLAVASVSGIRDFSALMNLAAANVAVMACGGLGERINYLILVAESERYLYNVGVKERRELVQSMQQNKQVSADDQNPDAMLKNMAAPSKDATALWIGWVIYVAQWTTVFYAFGASVARVNPPWFVPIFVVQLFVFFSSFGILEALWIYGYVKSYANKEWYYIMLSLSAKVSLTGLVIGAVF